MFVVELLLFVVPAIALLLAFMALVVRLPGETGPTLTRKRVLLAIVFVAVALASFAYAAEVYRSI